MIALLSCIIFDFYKRLGFSTKSVGYGYAFLTVDNAQENAVFGPLLCDNTTPFAVLFSACFGFTWFLRIVTDKRSHAIENGCLATEKTLRSHFYAKFYDIIAVMWELNVTIKRMLYGSVLFFRAVLLLLLYTKVLAFPKPGKCSMICYFKRV